MDFGGLVLLLLRVEILIEGNLKIPELIPIRVFQFPQQQLRAIILPADPVPIVQPRPEPFQDDEA